MNSTAKLGYISYQIYKGILLTAEFLGAIVIITVAVTVLLTVPTMLWDGVIQSKKDRRSRDFRDKTANAS